MPRFNGAPSRTMGDGLILCALNMEFSDSCEFKIIIYRKTYRYKYIVRCAYFL